MLESRRLKHFLTIYELGSIGQAAEKLLLTQPALSKSVRMLEDGLGVRLFERTTAGVVPTVFGKALALHAKAIQAQVRHAEAQLASLKGTAKGRVSIGIGPSMASALMPSVTRQLAARQPGIELEITEGLVDDLVPALRRGELDLAVGSWPRVTDAAFATEVLTSDQILVYARSDHPLQGRRIPLEELGGHAWALPPASQRWRQQLDELFFGQGLSPPHPAVISNSATYLKALLRSGDYLSFLPRLLVGDGADLAPLDVDMPVFAADVTMSYRERSLLNPACVEVAETFRTVAAEITAASA